MNKGTKWALGAIAGLLALPSTAVAVWPGQNGDIAFVSGRGAGGDASADIYILDGPLGAISAPLTPNLAGQHRHPNYSPDGSMLAFALFNGASDRDVWTVPTQQTGAAPLRNTDDQQEDRPAWSPDGKFIAYESEEPPTCPVADQPCDQFDVYITEVDDPANTVNLTAGTPTSNQGKPVWTPDGEDIIYQSEFSPTDLDILMEKADGSQASPSIIQGGATNEYQPSLSPDGSEMCFTRGGPLGSPAADVYKLAPVVNGGTITDISDNTAGAPTAQHADYNCAFSPDGEFIAFVQGTFSSGKLQYEDHDDADALNNSTPLTPETAGVNDTVFDGNEDWARVPLECNGKVATIVGTIGADSLKGTNGRDVIVGLKGADKIPARRGNDVVCGNAGGDTLFGAKGRDKLFGGPGGDDLTGGPGDDKCVGGPGNDTAKECEQFNPN